MNTDDAVSGARGRGIIAETRAVGAATSRHEVIRDPVVNCGCSHAISHFHILVDVRATVRDAWVETKTSMRRSEVGPRKGRGSAATPTQGVLAAKPLVKISK